MKEAQALSIFDMNSYYRKTEVEESQNKKPPFTSSRTLHQFTLMQFGLKNAHALLEHDMDIVLSTVKWQYALPTLGGRVIFTCKPRQHIMHICVILGLAGIL